MIFILLFVHIFLTVKLRFVQKHIFKGIKYSFAPQKTESGIGTYRAFAAALGTTIGPGNITGVAVAVSIGGEGALFWMWICGILAMATKYAESFLALRFKEKSGGTMTLLNMLGHPVLSKFWSAMCIVGGLLMGAAVPSNSLAASFSCPRWIIGGVLAFIISLTISFGFKGIANISALIVPVMSVAFTLFCGAVIVKNISALPTAFTAMLKNAFLPRSALGGGAGLAIKQGVTRGLYSNESGMGTGGVLAAEADDTNYIESSLAAMSTTFWDTVVMCAFTGIMLLCTGARQGMNPVTILNNAFSSIPFGKVFLSVSMSVFVYATAIGWYYIAKRVLEQLKLSPIVFDVLYIVAVFAGSVVNLHYVWKFADFVNYCLLVPSIFSILCLNNKILLYSRDN